MCVSRMGLQWVHALAAGSMFDPCTHARGHNQHHSTCEDSAAAAAPPRGGLWHDHLTVCQTVSGSHSSSPSSSSTESTDAARPAASRACRRSAAVNALSNSRQTSGLCLFLLWRYDGKARVLQMRSSSVASALLLLLLLWPAAGHAAALSSLLMCLINALMDRGFPYLMHEPGPCLAATAEACHLMVMVCCCSCDDDGAAAAWVLRWLLRRQRQQVCHWIALLCWCCCTTGDKEKVCLWTQGNRGACTLSIVSTLSVVIDSCVSSGRDSHSVSWGFCLDTCAAALLQGPHASKALILDNLSTCAELVPCLDQKQHLSNVLAGFASFLPFACDQEQGSLLEVSKSIIQSFWLKVQGCRALGSQHTRVPDRL